MHKVKQPFTTANRRFRVGTEVTEADCDSPDHFARLIELGYIEKADAAPVAEPEPPAAAV